MRLKVPFYKSQKDTDCGPLALKMSLEYLGEKHSYEEIARAERQLESGMVWSLGIVTAATRFGFRSKFVTQSNFSMQEDDIEYYRKYANDKAKIVLKELSDELKGLGIENIEKDMSLDELLSYVSKDSIPIVLVNWFTIVNKSGFSGHFLAVTGYDKENIYVHNPGIADAMAYLPIKRDIFLKAWECKGTDKDTIIIYRK